jgi:hypothetical protein
MKVLFIFLLQFARSAHGSFIESCEDLAEKQQQHQQKTKKQTNQQLNLFTHFQISQSITTNNANE